MTKVAAWSSDWTSEPAVDEEKTQLYGAPQFIEGKSMVTYGGTYMQRCAMPVMELAKHGYESILTFKCDSAPDGHILVMDVHGEWHDDVDVLILQRDMSQGADVAIHRARATGQKIIHDLDDQFWRLPTTNIAKDTTDPITHPTFNRDHYRVNLAAASAITVSTPELAREVEPLGAPVYVLRNMIQLERWPQLDPGEDGMIGWVGGIQWRANDMQVLRQFLPRFLEDCGLPFYHGGDSGVPGVPKAWELAGIDPKRVQCVATPIVHIAKYPGLFEHVNVMLIPLEDCRFNHAKSALKALESSASGIPFIASDLPEQRWFVEHGGAGRLATNWKPKTWVRHLDELLDPEVRRADGAVNRKHAEEFDIATNWWRWDEVYREVAA